MARFRKKPVVIEAFQMTRECATATTDWPQWLKDAWLLERYVTGSLFSTRVNSPETTFSIGTPGGTIEISWDEWIIQGVQGEIYPCAPRIFDQTYEPEE